MSAEVALPEVSGAIVHRKGRVADRGFIFSSWLSSMRSSMVEEQGVVPPFVVRVDRPTFSHGQHRRISRLLDDPQTRVLCAAVLDDLDVILGWAVAREDVLHYVFVKNAWRRRGIGLALVRALFPDGVGRFSIRTKAGDSFIVPKISGARFDPFQIDPRGDA